MSANPFVWYELVTSDVDAALRFYGKVCGWEGQEFPGGDQRYVILNANGKGIGGMTPPRGGSRSFWIAYVGTPDIDGTLSGFVRDGGKIEIEPWQIPDVGRLAMVSDPQGAGLALIQGSSEHKSEACNQQLPGHGNWHELHVPDPASAFGFYAAQFGWTKGDAMDMGPMGTYQIFKADGVQIGGMMRTMEGEPSYWLYYFGTKSIHDSIVVIKDAGGTVLRDPCEVPGGALILHAKDPQGALFALVGPA